MSNPSCLPSNRERLDSLQKSHQKLQNLYKEENQLRTELENELRSNQTKHKIEIELLEKNRKSLGKFSFVYSIGFIYREKTNKMKII